jgi:hypothetical protein
MRNTLEGGRRSPRRGDGCMFRARPRPRRDVGPVSSVAIGPMRPSPPSRRHPGHCSTIPDAVGARATRRRHACCCTPYGPPSAAPRVSARATTERKTPTPPPSKPLLGRHRARHDAPPEARFARTAVYSTVLCSIPSHVARTVRHACKLPAPWTIKGGAVP